MFLLVSVNLLLPCRDYYCLRPSYISRKWIFWLLKAHSKTNRAGRWFAVGHLLGMIANMISIKLAEICKNYNNNVQSYKTKYKKIKQNKFINKTLVKNEQILRNTKEHHYY